MMRKPFPIISPDPAINIGLQESVVNRYKKIAFTESIVVLVLCLLVFTGWYFNISTLKRGIQDSVSMNPVTALAFIFSIISFFCALSTSKKLRYAGAAIAFLVLGAGLIRIMEIGLFISTAITDLLFHSRLLHDCFAGIPNNMAPNTALCFIIAGASLASFHLKKGQQKLASDWLAIATALISFSCIIGYLYRGIDLYKLHGYIPMALPTAVSFFLLGTAILLYRSEFGMFRIFLTPYAGSRMARFLIPCAILLPVISGLVKAYGEESGWFSISSGVALFTTIHIVLFVIMIWQSTKSLNRSASELSSQRKRAMELDEQLRIEQTKEFERKLNESKLRQQNELIQAIIQAEEKEKKQIGMELHDHINQILASTKLYLELAKTDDSMRTEILDKCTSQLALAINEIRNLSKSLVLHEAESGDIVSSLMESINHIEVSSGIIINTDISDAAINSLSQKEKIAVYRIIQEQLSNVVKHSRASSASIRIFKEGDTVRLNISDDGKGFDVNKSHRGIGLSNIKNRVTSLNGDVKIISSHGNGCELSVRFPR